MTNLLAGLRRVVRLDPDRPCILCRDRAVSYREFYTRALQAGNALRELGIAKGDRVAVLMLNSPSYLELYYATAAIGAVVVPLNTRWSADEISFTLKDSGSKLLVVDDRFSTVHADVPLRLHVAEYDRAVARAAGAPPDAELQEHDLAGLFYTSGTTGGPKGAMLTHGNLLANALALIIEARLTRDWVWLHSAPMFHMADGGAMYALVTVGAAHCFIPAFEPEAFLQAIERYRVTAGLLVPTMFNMVAHHPALDRYDTSSLRFLLYGASPMPLELLRQGLAKFPRCEFMQGYGMTETSPLLTVLQFEDHHLDDTDNPFVPVKSVGRAVMGVELRVVDDQDRDLPPRQIGEVIARGANVMRGYWNRPEISAEVLRGGWMHTGDMGALDERGFLYILDRKKDMIKTGGENVYSPEVESVLYAHPDVLEAAVIGVADEKWGEAIKAVVVLKEGKRLTGRELIDFCREHLTHFKCPASVDFLDALPKSGTGKIQKNVLRQRYQ